MLLLPICMCVLDEYLRADVCHFPRISFSLLTYNVSVSKQKQLQEKLKHGRILKWPVWISMLYVLLLSRLEMSSKEAITGSSWVCEAEATTLLTGTHLDTITRSASLIWKEMTWHFQWRFLVKNSPRLSIVEEGITITNQILRHYKHNVFPFLYLAPLPPSILPINGNYILTTSHHHHPVASSPLSPTFTTQGQDTHTPHHCTSPPHTLDQWYSLRGSRRLYLRLSKKKINK